jgi:alkanesulfonate monooxygenase SsuD/methylene tetrahydromethanopterin reductase-like flavin-dependent oxidoreductase (luciferase family)
MIEGQQGVTWQDWCTLADLAERSGLEGLFRSDHYFSARGVSGVGATDAWTILAALAARTERLRLGTLVSPVTFREPAVLARAALTVDHISGGRVEIGMGAGWWAMLEEQVPIVVGLLTDDAFSFHGKHYRLEGADQQPKPVQRPRPPLILGGTTVGPRMQALIGRYADEFNTVGGTPTEVADRFLRARTAVEAAGRDPASLVTSLMTWFFVGRTEATYLDALRRAHALDPSAGPFDAYRADIEHDCIVGTPRQAIDRVRAYAEAGVQRIFLNHELYDDADMATLLTTDVLPEVIS